MLRCQEIREVYGIAVHGEHEPVGAAGCWRDMRNDMRNDMRKTAHEAPASMRLEAAIAAFLNYIKVERGLSANTIAPMRATCGNSPPSRRNAGCNWRPSRATTSWNSSVACIASAWTAAACRAIWCRCAICFVSRSPKRPISGDPTLNLESPKVRKSLPSYLRMEEVDRLLAQPDLSTPYGVRDKAIIELFIFHGHARL